MSTLQKWLVSDSSALANFIAWGSGVSSALALQFTQTNDPGQIVWTQTALTLSQVALTGPAGSGTATYTFAAGGTGPALRIGMAMVVAGFSTTQNNGTFVIQSFTGSLAAGGTFTVNSVAGQANESHAATATTTVTTLPTYNTFATGVEFWKFNDALATGGSNCVMKFQYGAGNGSTPGPLIQVTVATSTDGAGNLTGPSIVLPVTFNAEGNRTYTVQGQGTVPYECNFSYGSGYFAMMLWRDGNTNYPAFFGIERSRDTSGNPTGTYFTAVGASANENGQTWAGASGQYAIYPAGTGGVFGYWGLNLSTNTARSGFATIYSAINPTVYGGKQAFSAVFPLVGTFDNPLTIVGAMRSTDMPEGAEFQVNLYGQTRTYLFSQKTAFQATLPIVAGTQAATNGCGLAMRWD